MAKFIKICFENRGFSFIASAHTTNYDNAD